MAVALDTLAYARRLREAGFTEAQAEGQAEALAAAMTDTLATKQDLRELEIRLEEFEKRMDGRFAATDARIDARLGASDAHLEMRIGELRMAMRADLADLERRMTVRLGGMMVAGIAVVSALVKLI